MTGAVLVLVFIGLGWMYDREDMVRSYETYSGAVQDRAIERGWIPAYIPATAQDIVEVHNIDTNRQWIRFTVPESNAREMVLTLRPVDAPESARKARCLAVEWTDPATVYAWTC